MAVGAQELRGSIRYEAIEQLSGREAVGEEVAVPAAAEHPWPVGIRVGPVLHPPLHVLDGGGLDQVDPVERHAARHQIDPRVVESRQDGGALRVDHRRLRALQAGDLAIAADLQDLVAADGDCFGHRSLGVRRVDPRVVDDEVYGAVAVVALRADDEAGDQRDRDDGDDDEGGETGRHFDLRKRRVDAPQSGDCILVDRLPHCKARDASPRVAMVQCGAYAICHPRLRRRGRVLRRPSRPRRS